MELRRRRLLDSAPGYAFSSLIGGLSLSSRPADVDGSVADAFSALFLDFLRDPVSISRTLTRETKLTRRPMDFLVVLSTGGSPSESGGLSSVDGIFSEALRMLFRGAYGLHGLHRVKKSVKVLCYATTYQCTTRFVLWAKPIATDDAMAAHGPDVWRFVLVNRKRLAPIQGAIY